MFKKRLYKVEDIEENFDIETTKKLFRSVINLINIVPINIDNEINKNLNSINSLLRNLSVNPRK